MFQQVWSLSPTLLPEYCVPRGFPRNAAHPLCDPIPQQGSPRYANAIYLHTCQKRGKVRLCESARITQPTLCLWSVASQDKDEKGNLAEVLSKHPVTMELDLPSNNVENAQKLRISHYLSIRCLVRAFLIHCVLVMPIQSLQHWISFMTFA